MQIYKLHQLSQLNYFWESYEDEMDYGASSGGVGSLFFWFLIFPAKKIEQDYLRYHRRRTSIQLLRWLLVIMFIVMVLEEAKLALDIGKCDSSACHTTSAYVLTSITIAICISTLALSFWKKVWFKRHSEPFFFVCLLFFNIAYCFGLANISPYMYPPVLAASYLMAAHRFCFSLMYVSI